jgi:hypothetical protein
MGLPFASIPSDFTFICPNMLEQTTRVFLRVSGVILDFRSFSFQVPICGSAARHTPAPRKQNTKVNPIVRIFMRSIESGFRISVNTFQRAGRRRLNQQKILAVLSSRMSRQQVMSSSPFADTDACLQAIFICRSEVDPAVQPAIRRFLRRIEAGCKASEHAGQKI